MKVAFVSQPSDKVLPPIQTSVGAMTHGLARRLSEYHDVLVYGVRDIQRGGEASPEMREDGVSYRFYDSTAADRFLMRHIWKYGRLAAPFNRGMRPPPSASIWQSPQFGHQVAADVSRRHPDVVIVETCAQYAPPIHKKWPDAKVILILGAELFPQCPAREMERRFKSIDLVLGVSDYITNKTRIDYPSVADRCETLYCAVDAAEFTAPKQHAAGKGLTVMYAGGVSPHKGLHVLLDAFDLVARQIDDVHLDIVGPQGAYPISENYPLNDHERLAQVRPLYEGDYMELLRGRLTDRTRRLVTFVGQIPRPELVARYARADVFCFPSIWTEGCGIPPLEAMASGVPVVASRMGALSETVQDGVTGLIVEMGNVQQLADSLIRLLSDADLRARMGAAGRARVLEHFTYEAKGDQLAGYIDQICGSPVPGVPSR